MQKRERREKREERGKVSERERWRRLLLVLSLRRAGKQARGGAWQGAVLLAEEEEERKEKKLAENP